ncbi:hypothetical protein ACTFIW_000778 [Dictyostelium discoideum]
MHYNGPSVCKTKAVLLRWYNDTSYSHCKYASFIKRKFQYLSISSPQQYQHNQKYYQQQHKQLHKQQHKQHKQHKQQRQDKTFSTTSTTYPINQQPQQQRQQSNNPSTPPSSLNNTASLTSAEWLQ